MFFCKQKTAYELRISDWSSDVCSSDLGAPLLSAGPDGLRGDIRIPRIALRGASGSSPFSLTSGPANIDLSAMRWSLARADIRMGEGDSVTRFAADSLSGQATPQGMAGDLRGQSGKHGAEVVRGHV